MASFDSFRPYVQPEVPSCPVTLVDDAIREACRTFSSDTWLVREDLAAFPTVATTQSYTLVPAALTEVLAVKAVVLDGDTELRRGADSVNLRYIQQAGKPTWFWFRAGALWFYYTPDAVYSVEAEAVVRPTRTAATVSDTYLDYREAIATWAKYKLMVMVGMPWSNPDAARFNYSVYSALTGEQRIRDMTGRVGAQLRVAPNFF